MLFSEYPTFEMKSVIVTDENSNTHDGWIKIKRELEIIRSPGRVQHIGSRLIKTLEVNGYKSTGRNFEKFYMPNGGWYKILRNA